MSAHAEMILSSAKQNRELAMEIFCELYIYTHYTENEVGIDIQAYTYQYDYVNNTDNSWLNNLMYRLSSIFRRKGLHISIDEKDIGDLIANSHLLVAYN